MECKPGNVIDIKMLKDIKETPDVLNSLLKSHIVTNQCITTIKFPVNSQNIDKIYVVASGSSRNVGNVAKYFIEKVANIPVIVDFASEFAHRTPSISKNDLLILLSQSGETADVIASLKKAKQMDLATFAVTNNKNSSIHRLSDFAMDVQAGIEESIPATKSFTCQLMCLYILGLYLAENRKTLSKAQINSIKQDLLNVPEKIKALIDHNEDITRAADKIKDFNNLIILGRGQNSALAEEGALKIKETSYINASGMPTGEFMHGHVAVLDENFPIISLLTRCFSDEQNYTLAQSNTKQINAKRKPILITIGHDPEKIKDLTDFFINIEENNERITPFLTTVILQLLADEIAKLLGRDVNKPRSLNKIVLDE